jgi:hypothetical protein
MNYPTPIGLVRKDKKNLSCYGRQRAVLYTAARLDRGRVGATLETMPGLDRPDVSVMIRNGAGAETERFVTRALH